MFMRDLGRKLGFNRIIRISVFADRINEKTNKFLQPVGEADPAYAVKLFTNQIYTTNNYLYLAQIMLKKLFLSYLFFLYP